MLFKDLSALLSNRGLQFEKVGADKELTFKILGSRLRIGDRKILESAYRTNISSFEKEIDDRPGGHAGPIGRDGIEQANSSSGIDRPSFFGGFGKKRVLQADLGKVRVIDARLLARRGGRGL
jgi:hypothetical protein